MKKHFFAQFAYRFVVLTAAFCATAVFATAAAAWSGPSQNPPNGNPPPPLNTGDEDQEKEGGIVADWFAGDELYAEYIGVEEGVESGDWMWSENWIGSGGAIEADDWISAPELYGGWMQTDALGTDELCLWSDSEWEWWCFDADDFGELEEILEDGGGSGTHTSNAPEWLWGGQIGPGNSTQNIWTSRDMDNYTYIMLRGQGGEHYENVLSTIPVSFLKEVPGQYFAAATFSGDDSGYVGISWVNDYQLSVKTYRKGTLWAIYGIR